jgi:D-sedoheptulose 7-phosphate isomerase
MPVKKDTTTHSVISQFMESYFDEVQKTVKKLNGKEIIKAIELILEAYRNEKNVYVLGNGGSASIASHLACDLGKGTLNRVYDESEKRVRVISLTDNTSLITAYANDVGYDAIFLQQLRNLIEKDDVLIAISGSGNSKNVINAVKYAKKVGATVIGFAGFLTGGKLAELSDIKIISRSSHYGPIEDTHMMVGHLIAACLAHIKKGEQKGKKGTNKAVPFSKS